MDCIDGMKQMSNNSVDLTLTDIPYDAVNRDSNGLRNLNKGIADVLTFDIATFRKKSQLIERVDIRQQQSGRHSI